jgi:hypothetical protein
MERKSRVVVTLLGVGQRKSLQSGGNVRVVVLFGALLLQSLALDAQGLHERDFGLFHLVISRDVEIYSRMHACEPTVSALV